MSGSGRERPRQRDRGHRHFDHEPPPSPHRVFRIAESARQQVARALRRIDDARRALEDQQNQANREIIRELRTSADEVYDLINGLEEIDDGR